MKKGIIIGGALSVFACAGLWWLARRPQGLASPVEADRPLFEVTPQGLGSLIQVNPPGPLRNVSWLRPLPGGHGLCFIATQADQQILGVFQDGALQHSFPLPLTDGIDASYYRKATLRDAAFTAQALYLLFGDEDHPHEPGLLLCLDSATGALRGFQRAPAQKLALAGESVLIYGPDVPVMRVTFRQKKVDAVSYDLPPEVRAPEVLVATGSKGFLIAHQAGLSAYLGEGGWKHTPLPPSGPLVFPAAHTMLARAGKSLWWQPAPGRLLEVDDQGTVLRDQDLTQIGVPQTAPNLDQGLLALLGADPEGQLWFTLAAPDLSKTAPAQPSTEGTGPAALTSEARAALEVHLKQPMDRLYRLSKDGSALTKVSLIDRWPALQAPTDLPRPSGTGALAPEGGAFLLGEGLRRWWLPVQAVTP